MNSSKAELQAELRKAFGDVPFPSHCGYHAAIAMDSWISDPEELRQITALKDKQCSWWDLVEEDLPLISLAQCYFDARATKFYLPAQLSIAISSPKFSNYNVLISWLTPGVNDESCAFYDHFIEKFSEITAREKNICREVMLFFRKRLEPNDIYSMDEIDRILGHSYWLISK